MSYEAGQRVVVVSTNRGVEITEDTICRVGRKYAYVQDRWGRDRPFDMETGVEKDGYGHRRIYTPEAWAETQRRAGIEKALRERHDVSFRRSGRVSTPTLGEILCLLDADAADRS
jgi:hypothetical protein